MENIVFVVSCMGKGGAQRVISNLANYLCDMHNITIILLFSSEINYDLDSRIMIRDYSVSKLLKIISPFLLILKLRSFFKTYRKKNIKIVAFLTKVNLITILANIGLSNTMIISERNDPKNDRRNKIILFLSALLYPLANAIVFQTEYAKKFFSKRIQNKSQIICNPVVIPDVCYEVNDQKNIISIGRLIPQKNHIMLINAFSQIAESYRHINLLIYGEGFLRDKLEEKIKSLQLSNRILLNGVVDNINDELYKSMIFVLSSDYEGQSNALLEAMAIGMPCITTNCSGINEIIDNTNGILISQNNVEELVDALVKLINNREIRSVIGSNARKSMNRFTVEEISLLWLNLIKNPK